MTAIIPTLQSSGILPTMTYQISQPPVESEQRRPYIWLERLLIVAFVLCILVGVLALIALVSLRNDV